MVAAILVGMINNAALLLALTVIYEVRYILPKKCKNIIPLINGFLIGLIGLAIMLFPFEFEAGIFFDTRTILISISALTFGPFQTAIAASMLIIFRLIRGGAGLAMGVSSIITSALAGIIWRRFFLSKNIRHRWTNIYVFGIIVHLLMLACALTMPLSTALIILREISVPVMLICPVGTVLLSLLLLRQKERNESLIRIAEAEERYKSLFNNSHAVMLLIDPENGQIVDVNLAASDFYGWTPEIMKTMNISQIEVKKHFVLKKNEGDRPGADRSKPIVSKHKRAYGYPVDVEVYDGTVAINGKNLLFSIVHDISERTLLEQKKNEVEAHLRQQQKLEAIGTLAGGVAHEINNPINGIMNYAQLILDDRSAEDHDEYAKEIIKETERISGIVKKLLQFSRQERQSHSYASIYDIINDTVQLIRTVIKGDQIDLKISLEEHLPDIKCRSQQIQQVLLNLLTNARDALNEKYENYHRDKLIYVRCGQFTAEDQRWIRITVEDHGKGIPAELHDKIFEPFFSTKPKEKGTGLGLSISYGIIKEHNGRISFDSRVGSGTKFVVDLPVDNGWSLHDSGIQTEEKNDQSFNH